jgi:hypothetical protein
VQRAIPNRINTTRTSKVISKEKEYAKENEPGEQARKSKELSSSDGIW